MIYTIGYSGIRLDDLMRYLGAEDGMIVDSRFLPSSRDAQWRKPFLQKTLGDRYVHVQAFGNKNFREGPTELLDPEGGIREWQRLRQQWPERKLILMCMCWSWNFCHRNDAAKAIAVVTGEDIRHLVRGDIPKPPPEQQSLF